MKFVSMGIALCLIQSNLVWAQESLTAVVQTGHGSVVTCVAISKDSRFALTGSRDGSAILWDLKAGGQIRSFHGHSSWVTDVAFSSDGKQALTGSRDGKTIFWEIASGRGCPLPLLEGSHESPIISVAFDVSRRAVTCSEDGKLVHWNLKDREPSGKVELPGSKGRVASGATLRRNRLFIAATGQTAIIWRLEGKGIDLQAVIVSTLRHSTKVTSVAGYRGQRKNDPKYVVTGAGKQAFLWSAETGERLKSFSHPATVSTVAISRDRKKILTGTVDGNVTLWDSGKGLVLKRLEGHSEHVTSAAFSQDGKHVLTGSRDRSAILWNVESGKAVQTLAGRIDSDVRNLKVGSKGQYLVTSVGNKAMVWDLWKGRPIDNSRHPNLGMAVDFSSDTRSAVTASGTGAVTFWDLHSGESQKALRGKDAVFEGDDVVIITAAISPDGNFALTGSTNGSVVL